MKMCVKWLTLQDKGGEGAKELEELQSDRLKVVQLDVCSEEQVTQAVEHIREALEDSERGMILVFSSSGNMSGAEEVNQ